MGYSRQDIDNSNAQGPTAFKKGEYALANLLYTPVPNAMVGGELQWGRRKNVNGFQSEGFKLQFSFKYNFTYKLRRVSHHKAKSLEYSATMDRSTLQLHHCG